MPVPLEESDFDSFYCKRKSETAKVTERKEKRETKGKRNMQLERMEKGRPSHREEEGERKERKGSQAFPPSEKSQKRNLKNTFGYKANVLECSFCKKTQPV